MSDKPGFTIVDKRNPVAMADASLDEKLRARFREAIAADLDFVSDDGRSYNEDKAHAGSEYLVRLDNEYPDGVTETVVSKRDSAMHKAAEAMLEPIATDGMVSVHELYAVGLPVLAFDDIAPNTLLLMPIRRPGTSEGGIVTSVDEEKGTLGTNCVAYHVAGVGPVAAAADQHPQTWLPVEAGDVVIVRNAMLDTLHPDLEPLQIHRRHVLAKLRVREFTKVVAE